jgi:hypothetical protein
MNLEELMNTGGRTNSPNIKNKFKEDILLIKRSNPDLSGAKIRKALEKIYPESKYIPKKRTVEKIIHDNRNIWGNNTPSPLDQPWSIGLCEEYKIPADIIPTLIECEKIESKKFTVREAQWVAKLKPVVYEMVKREFPKDSPLGYLIMIAYQYSHKEKISELTNEKLDTTELDDDIFFNTSKDSLAIGLVHGYNEHENK